MKADRPLWIDSQGRLCESPPATGYKIAGVEGVDIPEHVVQQFGLTVTDGRITQGGKVRAPKQPARMVADRELFADSSGKLYDTPQGTGIKIADAGRKIPVEYVRRYNLSIEGDRVVQKNAPDLTPDKDAVTKAVEAPPNKGARGSGGLTVDSRRTGGKRTSKGAS